MNCSFQRLASGSGLRILSPQIDAQECQFCIRSGQVIIKQIDETAEGFGSPARLVG